MSSRESRIMTALAARLATIDGSGSFNYDLGGRVYNGREDFSVKSDTFPLASIVDQGGDLSDDTQPHRAVFASREYSAIGYVVAPDPDQPLQAGYDLLEDFQRALFPASALSAGRDSLGGLVTQFLYGGDDVFVREDARRTTGVELRFTLSFARNLSAPDQ